MQGARISPSFSAPLPPTHGTASALRPVHRQHGRGPAVSLTTGCAGCGLHWVSSPEIMCLFLLVKAVLNWAEHSVREQLCLLEMFKLAVRFLIDVFDLGEQLCSRPVGRRSNVRNVPSAGYGSMLLIG